MITALLVSGGLCLIGIVIFALGFLVGSRSAKQNPQYMPPRHQAIVVPRHNTQVVGPFSLPSFGRPTLETYHVADYIDPLKCSQDCGRELHEGERFYSIPIDEPKNGVVAVCLPCYGKAI